MKISLLSFLNPAKIIRAHRYRKEIRQYDRSAFDLELYLYANILSNDMLHYGYFDDVTVQPQDISVGAMEIAQNRYAQLIIDEISGMDENDNRKILDAGCGMGGLTGLMIKNGFEVEALTPNDHQIEYVREKHTGIRTHHCKYELLAHVGKYSTVIHSESLQYISLEDSFSKTEEILEDGGRWIITDYFRTTESGINTSGHQLEAFKDMIQNRGWNILKERDITTNVLPTLRLIRFYADRFLLPLKHFGLEKFRFKKPFWYSMTDTLRGSINSKLEKELASIDPEKFIKEKKYMLFVLEKPSRS